VPRGGLRYPGRGTGNPQNVRSVREKKGSISTPLDEGMVLRKFRAKRGWASESRKNEPWRGFN